VQGALQDFRRSDPGSVLESHRAALRLHCYRMTGSFCDAEDLVQETFLRAWKSFDAFKGRSSLRTWLYRIATNVCLDALKRRRPPRLLRPSGPASDPRDPVGPPSLEIAWLEPYPDSELGSTGDGPEDRLLAREKISLAFLAVLQALPPRQRAVFILSDILDWKTNEVAALLDTSAAAVDSALHRARTTVVRRRRPMEDGAPAPAAAADESTRSLLDQYVSAWEANDVDRIVTLLHQDAVLSMPPFTSWYQGRESVGAILRLHPFGSGRRAGWRLLPTRANAQPAFVLYRADRPGEDFQAFGLMVISTFRSPAAVSALTIFKDTALVARFGFPPVLKTA
jgi:RNA polymerase sigma-70 factor, ECF subfamily